MNFKGSHKAGEFEGNFAYFPQRDKKVLLTLDGQGVGASLAAHAAKLRSKFGGTVAVDLK